MARWKWPRDKSNQREDRCWLPGLFPIPRYRWVLKTIQLRATRPLSLIVYDLHPNVENGPGQTTGALQLSLQHVHQQCIATDGDANFVRQPFHELRKARMFLKGCFVYVNCSEFIYF